VFKKTAKYYDAIYSFKDYGAEADRIRSLIERARPGAKSILDVACGTGEHARLLTREFAVDGIDLEPQFVAIAHSKIGRGNFSVADMRHFRLGKRYDVVLCLFSSIGYVLEEAGVVQTIRCFAEHLAEDGIVIVEPWLTPESWETGKPGLAPPVDRPDLKVCRVHVSDRRGDRSILNFHYLIATPAGVEHLEEQHELALYTNEQMLRCFHLAGLAASYESGGLSGRGLYIARRPQQA
jgi:SAM-dependent methyltransferase